MKHYLLRITDDQMKALKHYAKASGRTAKGFLMTGMFELALKENLVSGYMTELANAKFHLDHTPEEIAKAKEAMASMARSEMYVDGRTVDAESISKLELDEKRIWNAIGIKRKED